MQIDILTLFPEMFQGPFEDSILKRARERGLLDIRVHNFREYGLGRHRQVDDAPYGGGAGMLLRPEPLFAAIEVLLGRSLGDGEHPQPPGPSDPPVILMSPQGRQFSQAIAAELAGRDRLIFVCGHYEGVDERVRRQAVSDEISIGDYVLTGGELAAMVVVDAVARLIPGVLGGETSAEEESFVHGLLEYPHYTRPPDFRGWGIPDVLLSGHHAEIASWRRRQAILRTLERRPDLLPTVELTRDEQRWLEGLRRERQPVPTDLPRRVQGIDFSGAETAGKKIWIASGTLDGDRLRFDACRRADSLPDSGPDRGACLSALRAFIAEQGASAIGLDFPFGLPKPFLGGATWEQLVLSFADRYPTAEVFREACRTIARSPELKRTTDVESKTPFSTYGVRIYKQTYYGIRDVLAPLVREHLVSVLPMQRPTPGKPWLLEICPASTLKLERVYKPPYKGSEAGQRGARYQILRQLEERGCTFASSEVADTALADTMGDALDSIVAAFATFRALQNPARLTTRAEEVYSVEGYVYV